MKSVKLSYLDEDFEISAESSLSLFHVLTYLGCLAFDAYELASNQGYKHTGLDHLSFAGVLLSKCKDLSEDLNEK